jgi:drug/metabolite transporter (DMT)-like permease
MSNNLLGYLLALASSLGYGSVTVIVKKGLLDYSSPLVGVSISLSTGTLLMGLLSFRAIDIRPTQGRKGMAFFLISGMAAGLAQLSIYLALSQAPVVLVSPVVSANPLITILLVHLFLQGLERVSQRIVLAASFIVAGVILVSLGSG